jgi:hypothetical protein
MRPISSYMNARIFRVFFYHSLISLSALIALGQDWQTRSTPTSNNLFAVTAGEEQFVAVGQRTTILRSLDGIHWSQVPFGQPGYGDLFSVAYGNGMFVAGGESNVLLIVSPDGENWTGKMSVAGDQKIYGLTFANGRFVAVGRVAADEIPYVLTSTNGIDWESPSRPTRNTLRAVAYDGRFVAVGDLGTIMVSPDAFNWTMQDSGTPRTLRAATYAGRSIVAGDVGTVLMWNGTSWFAAAPVSFDVKGLVLGEGVVAVGSYGSIGRMHTSEDGLTWPGNSLEFPQPLNDVARVGNRRLMAVGNNGLIIDAPDSEDGANSWTKTTSGYWEEPYWSLGQLPAYAQNGVVFTNAGWKALAIGSSTTMNYPESLRIGGLLVDAPPDSKNLLLLNYAGLATPLHSDVNIIVGPNGSLLSYYSAVESASLFVNGQATFAEYGQSQFGSVEVGRSSAGELTLSNGWFSASRVRIAEGAPSTFNQFGGTNNVAGRNLAEPEGRMWISTEGTYNLSGGTLNVGTLELYPAASGPAQLNIAGGLANVRDGLRLGGDDIYNERRGEVLLSGGLFKSASILVPNGQMTQTGGTNQTRAIYLSGTPYNHGDYGLREGRVDSGDVYIGRDEFFNEGGAFGQSGGVHSNSVRIVAYGRTISEGTHYINGFYSLSGGLLCSPTIALAGGRFTQRGGTNYVQRLVLTNGGSYELDGGILVSFRTDIENYVAPTVRPRFFQGGGKHRTQQLWLESGGIYELQGGTLAANNISVRASAQFRLGAGVLSNDLIEVNGGTLFLGGNHDLGWLQFNGYAYIDFQSGSSIVRFNRIGYPPPAIDGVLYVKNWKGSPQSPGRDQMYIINTGEDLPYHLSGVFFVDPYGYPPGNYPARRKETGEIVPLEPGRIDYTRYHNTLSLNWVGDYQLLSATNVAGPYQPVPGATSYYNLFFTDPARFFILKPSP